MIRPVILLLSIAISARAETCRYIGTTSYDGRLAVRTETTQAASLLTLDVTIEFTVHAWMTDYRYLGQEITTWSLGKAPGAMLQSIAVNQRSLADGTIKRQQWDVFTRNGSQLEGYRVQAKTLADFRQRHPGFVAHWSPTSFAQPWLPDYHRAGAERRPDLDLPAGAVQTPLAAAFYWSRFLPPSGGPVSLVLPSFKRDKQLTLNFGPAAPGDGRRRWSTPLRHPALEAGSPSSAAAWVSADHYLLQLDLDVRTSWAEGQANLRTQGCQGIQISPS